MYVLEKLTYTQLNKKIGIKPRAIQTYIENISLNFPKIIPCVCVVGIDTTWFGTLGLTIVRDVTNKKNITWKFTQKENQLVYSQLVEICLNAGIIILGIVVDGKDSFFHSFGDIPIQMCHFHMAQILRKYLTKNPVLECNKELWKVWYSRKKHSKSTFTIALLKWYLKYSHELVKGYINTETNKWEYSMDRTLSAYRSLRKFTPYLFTYQSSKWIPTTNNSLEGINSDLKNKMRNHNGLRWDRKAKVLHFYLKNPKK